MMMKIKVQDQNQEEEIREAFKVFDNVSYYFVYFRSDLCYRMVMDILTEGSWP